MAKIVEVVKLKSGYANFVELKSAFDASQENADRQVFDLSFVDLRLGTDSGLDLIPSLLGACPWLKIVVITAYASVDTAVKAMRRGATDYIPKPFTPGQVELVTDRVAMVRGMEQRIATLKEDLERLHPEVSFSSQYPDMQRAMELARQVAASEAVILLRGPSGTGKTVLARAIHGWSRRADKPLAIIILPDFAPATSRKRAIWSRQGRLHRCAPGQSSPDQIMVCLSSRGPNSEALLRYASRLAGRLNRNWYALYVQTSQERPTVIDAATQRIFPIP